VDNNGNADNEWRELFCEKVTKDEGRNVKRFARETTQHVLQFADALLLSFQPTKTENGDHRP
jgi:cell division protein FtsL